MTEIDIITVGEVGPPGPPGADGGVGSIDDVIAGGASGLMTGADKTKLDGVAAGATANSSDATLKARANHTGSQLASTISDFAATVRATVLTGLSLAAGTTVAATHSVLEAIGFLQKQATDNAAAILLKAPSISPTFTGVPLAPTAADLTNTTQLATTQYVVTRVAQAVADLVASSPAALDTLDELAAALGDDANFAATTATALGNRLRVDTAAQALSGTQQGNALTNLGFSANAQSLVGAANYAAMRTLLSLDSVTNDAQTKAAIVPNTAPAAGEVLVGNVGGTAYAKQAVSGDATMASTGALTLATVNSNVGSFKNADITLDAKGRATAAAHGSECLPVACSDETTSLTTGLKVTFRMPYAFTLTAVRGSLTTAATGATLFAFDVKESGSSIFSTKPTFNASEKTTTTAATAAVISDPLLADDAEMTVIVDAVGNTIAGAGLKVYLIGHRT